MRAEAFFAYAYIRETIRRRRAAGEPAPWTTDPILQTYRFCNVDREDDAVTTWFRDMIREPLRFMPEVLLATILFRWFNTVETGRAIFTHPTRPPYPCLTPWGEYLQSGTLEPMSRAIRAHLPKGPYVTGAYMIKTPAGMDKVAGVLWCVDEARKKIGQLGRTLLMGGGADSLEAVTALLARCDYIGDFMAYEIVTDLRHTDLLCNAPDIMTWANPGPGAARGLDRVFGFGLDQAHALSHGGRRNRANVDDRAAMQVEMRQLLALSQDNNYWPSEWKPWEMRTVEHTLCEFDKYERVRLGEGRPKQLFRKGATA